MTHLNHKEGLEMKKFYSDLTNKVYDKEEELEKAEADYAEALAAKNKKVEERKADWKKVQEAYALANSQLKAAEKLESDFYDKYITVHGTKDSKDAADDSKEIDAIVDHIDTILRGLNAFPFFR